MALRKSPCLNLASILKTVHTNRSNDLWCDLSGRETRKGDSLDFVFKSSVHLFGFNFSLYHVTPCCTLALGLLYSNFGTVLRGVFRRVSSIACPRSLATALQAEISVLVVETSLHGWCRISKAASIHLSLRLERGGWSLASCRNLTESGLPLVFPCPPVASSVAAVPFGLHRLPHQRLRLCQRRL